MLTTFERKHDFLVCINSCCVMNTRARRHFHCYGPQLVLQWDLEAWRIPVLERWNQVNLLRMTRGMHPFKALAMVLSEVDQSCTPIAGVESLRMWAESAEELSEGTLMAWIQSMEEGEGRRCLENALAWSKACRAGIEQLPPELISVFPGVEDALGAIGQMADVAVLAEDSYEAVKADWTQYGVLKFADVILPSESGSKHQRIASIMKYGYQPNHVLVVGDTPEDWDGAVLNDVGFFPIVVSREGECWQALRTQGLERLRSLAYRDYEQEAKEQFLAGLGAK